MTVLGTMMRRAGGGMMMAGVTRMMSNPSDCQNHERDRRDREHGREKVHRCDPVQTD
jgi:hypothetical protein